MKAQETQAFFTLFKSMGWDVLLFRPMHFTIINKINGFEHDSCGMAVISKNNSLTWKL